jgi:hypothetical protein
MTYIYIYHIFPLALSNYSYKLQCFSQTWTNTKYFSKSHTMYLGLPNLGEINSMMLDKHAKNNRSRLDFPVETWRFRRGLFAPHCGIPNCAILAQSRISPGVRDPGNWWEKQRNGGFLMFYGHYLTYLIIRIMMKHVWFKIVLFTSITILRFVDVCRYVVFVFSWYLSVIMETPSDNDFPFGSGW